MFIHSIFSARVHLYMPQYTTTMYPHFSHNCKYTAYTTYTIFMSLAVRLITAHVTMSMSYFSNVKLSWRYVCRQVFPFLGLWILNSQCCGPYLVTIHTSSVWLIFLNPCYCIPTIWSFSWLTNHNEMADIVGCILSVDISACVSKTSKYADQVLIKLDDLRFARLKHTT